MILMMRGPFRPRLDSIVSPSFRPAGATIDTRFLRTFPSNEWNDEIEPVLLLPADVVVVGTGVFVIDASSLRLLLAKAFCSDPGVAKSADALDDELDREKKRD